MEDIFYRFLYSVKRKDPVLYGVVIVLLCVLTYVLAKITICILEVFDPKGIISNIVASFLGVVAVFVFARIVSGILHWAAEDHNKVSYLNRDMWKQYGTNYRQIFSLHNSNFLVYFEPLFRYQEDKTQLSVIDHPTDFFSIDPFIKAHCFTLLEAHAMSKKVDCVTVRLTDCIRPTEENNNTATIHCGRSSYLAHLLTNRALDYMIQDGITIRQLFENDKTLRPLSRAMLSNHFGVNALVFLTGEKDHTWLLLPQRTNKATVAKNSVTASIAARLELKEEVFSPDAKEGAKENYIKEGCVRDQIAKQIWVNKEWLKTQSVKIRFLGLSRDIYEGGKPTLFYAVELNLTPEKYLSARSQFLDEKKKKKHHLFRKPLPDSSIDEVKTIHIADWESVKMSEVKSLYWFGSVIQPELELHDVRLDAARLTFNYIDTKKKQRTLRTKSLKFEQNLIANFWFNEPNMKRSDLPLR